MFSIFYSLPALSDSCVGHIFFFNFENDSYEVSSDYEYYYEQLKEVLKADGISYSKHESLPLLSDTCFSKLVTINKIHDEVTVGYILVRPDKEKKIISGVITDVDLVMLTRDYFR